MQEYKKTDEGIQLFESIHDKLTSSQNPSQKEKLEDALKKEIKKLQRSRDKIKGWASGSEIKDKKPLQDKRKQIETVRDDNSNIMCRYILTWCSAWRNSRLLRKK